MEEDQYIIFNNIDNIQEKYKGTNNLDYKHIYYLSIASSDENNNQNENIDSYEISKIKWLTWSECINKIRPYYKNKIEIINNIFMFIMNLYIEISNKSEIQKQIN